MMPRKSISSFVLSVCEKYGATRYLFATYEYELDELRRNIEVYDRATLRGIQVDFEHDEAEFGNVYMVSKTPW
jgi:hypothetical protein